MQAQDAYKLVYQAACGPAHAITDPDSARTWLEKEVQTLHDPYPEPIFDPISPDGSLVRVHLAPYLADGGDLETFLHAFLRTSREIVPDFEKLEGYLTAALNTFPCLKSFKETLQAQGYPAVHHSEAYRTTYKPAYRVVLKHLI